MEQEFFFSGYCRQLDCSRIVTAVTEDGILTEVDCSYPDCPFAADCTVGQNICGLTDIKPEAHPQDAERAQQDGLQRTVRAGTA